MTFPGDRQPLVDEPRYGEPRRSEDHSRTDRTQESTTDVAKSEAAAVTDHARESVQQVAQTSVDQAKDVGHEALQQARNLADEAREQVMSQASDQQARAAKSVRSLADELATMANSSQQNGVATELARQASERARQFATFLDKRRPGDVLDEVRELARRRPGVFLAGAAFAGVVLGRLTRGAVDEHRSTDTPTTSNDTPTAGERSPGKYARQDSYPPDPGLTQPYGNVPIQDMQ